jgi:hypothetical protein
VTAAEVDTLPHVVETPYTLPPVDDLLPAEGPISDAYWSVSALPPTPAGPGTIDAEFADDLGLTGVVDPDQRAWDPTLIGHGTEVVAADGKILRHVERLTLDPTTHRLTHVVIKHGLLGEEEEIAVGRIDRIEDGVLFLV